MKITQNLIRLAIVVLIISAFQSCCLLTGAVSSCKIKKSDYATLERTTSNDQISSNNRETISGPAINESINPVNTEAKNKDIPPISSVGFKEAKELPLGIKSIGTTLLAGPNLSFKSSKEDYGNTNHKHKPGAGFQVGVGSIIKFTNKVSFTPALLFKQNNASEELSYSTGGGGTSYSSESKYKYNWLSAPLLMNFQATDKLSIKAGPEVNYLLKATVKSTGESQTRKEDITDESQKVGVGAQVGVSYNISNDGAWILSLIYDHRISRLNKKDGGTGGGYEVPAWNMRGIQLGVTCAICNLLKKK